MSNDITFCNYIELYLISFQGTHGIRYEESIDDTSQEEINFTDSEFVSLNSTVSFEQLTNRKFKLISNQSHPEAFVKTTFSRLLSVNR